MDLLIVQLKAAIRRLLDGKGVRARVLDKVNRYGEVVIGVILEKPTPPRIPAAAERRPGEEEPQREHGDAREGRDAREREREREPDERSPRE